MRCAIKYLLFILVFTSAAHIGFSQENNSILCSDGIDNDGDGQIDCDDQECATLQNNGCRTCFNDGLSFADNVIEYNNPCGGLNMFDDPNLALGVSDLGNLNGRFVSLGSGGWIKLGFVNNVLVNSGNGDSDLWVFEIGDAVEPTLVELRPADAATRAILISAGISDGDSDGYYDFGRVAGATASIDIDAFTGGTAGLLKFDAVKLTDESARGCNGQTPGADIDAICALSSIPNEICGNNIDDDGDGFTDCDDPDLASECCCISTLTLDLGEDIITCVGDTITLSNADMFVNYEWQDGSAAPTRIVNSTELYRLTVTDNLGCQQVDQINVVFRELPRVNTHYFKCPNVDITINQVTYSESGFFFDTVFISQSPCDTIYSVQISNYPTVNNFLGSDLVICEPTLTITSPYFNTDWSDGSSGSHLTITETQTILATAIDSNTCEVLDSLVVDFIRIDNFYVPNAFSPNNDGINDEFAPLFTQENNVNYTLRIFDRWGNKLTDISGIEASWDGFVDNKLSINGNYLWTLEFINEICGTPESHQGELMIVR